MMNTNTKLKATLVMVGMCLAVGCSKQEAPGEGAAATQSTAPAVPAAPPAAAPAAEAPVAVAVTAYEVPASLTAGGNCALDAINGGPVAGASFKAGSETLFAGWVGDAANQVPSEARLVLKGADNSYAAPLVAGVERPDVAAALGAEALRLSGYHLLARLDVAPGTYDLSIVHGAADALASCPLNVSLTITE